MNFNISQFVSFVTQMKFKFSFMSKRQTKERSELTQPVANNFWPTINEQHTVSIHCHWSDFNIQQQNQCKISQSDVWLKHQVCRLLTFTKARRICFNYTLPSFFSIIIKVHEAGYDIPFPLESY